MGLGFFSLAINDLNFSVGVSVSSSKKCCGCCTLVQHQLCAQEFMGLNPTGCWAVPIFILSFKEVFLGGQLHLFHFGKRVFNKFLKYLRLWLVGFYNECEKVKD